MRLDDGSVHVYMRICICVCVRSIYFIKNFHTTNHEQRNEKKKKKKKEWEEILG